MMDEEAGDGEGSSWEAKSCTQQERARWMLGRAAERHEGPERRGSEEEGWRVAYVARRWRSALAKGLRQVFEGADEVIVDKDVARLASWREGRWRADRKAWNVCC